MKVSSGTRVSLVYTVCSNDGISPRGMSLYVPRTQYKLAPHMRGHLCDSASFSLVSQRCKKHCMKQKL